jgi:hypothetical protein
LAAFLGRLADRLLGLFLGADKEHLSAFADCRRQKIAGGFDLVEGSAQVNDVNAVASIKDERLHFGVPPFGLVTEMDPGIEQFFYANTNHKFSFG